VLDTGIAAIDAIETQRSTDFLGYEILAEQSDTYNEKTAPLKDYYAKKGKFKNIEGTSSEEVVNIIKQELGIA
jgi:adenylate kinase family enzyme